MQRLRTHEELEHERRRRREHVAGRPSAVDAVLIAVAVAVVVTGLFGPAVVLALTVGAVAGAALAM